MSRRIALLNPNSNAQTTARMLEIARQAAPKGFDFEGFTASAGPPIILDEPALLAAEAGIVDAGEALSGGDYAGLLVCGFGDPGVEALRARVALPVTGLAEAGLQAAAAAAPRFSIVTTTPALEAAIRRRAVALGHGAALVAIRITPGDPAAVMGDAARLDAALAALCAAAIEEDGAGAILVGGGPLAAAALRLAPHVPVPLIDPVSAAARLACRRAGAAA